MCRALVQIGEGSTRGRCTIAPTSNTDLAGRPAVRALRARTRRPRCRGARVPMWGCFERGRAGSVAVGSGLIPALVIGRRCARSPSARRRVARRRRQRGARPTPTTSSSDASTSVRRRSRTWARRRRRECRAHFTDFPGSSRKTSSGRKVLHFLGNSADSSCVPRKTRCGHK